METFLKFIDTVRSYPPWVQSVFIVWVVITALGVIGLARGPRSQPMLPAQPGQVNSEPANHPMNTTSKWPTTGDTAIDMIHGALNELGASTSEASVAAALRPLFFRNLFHHIAEERPESALFALCRSEKLLEYYQTVSSRASVRTAVGHARTRLVKLQQQLETLFGPAFSAEIQCEQWGNNRDAYIRNMPTMHGDNRDPIFVKQANQTLTELRSALYAAGLSDRP